MNGHKKSSHRSGRHRYKPSACSLIVVRCRNSYSTKIYKYYEMQKYFHKFADKAKKPMEKVLGIDLGTNSVGWAVIEREGDARRLVDKGVAYFRRAWRAIRASRNPPYSNAPRLARFAEHTAAVASARSICCGCWCATNCARRSPTNNWTAGNHTKVSARRRFHRMATHGRDERQESVPRPIPRADRETRHVGQGRPLRIRPRVSTTWHKDVVS